MVGHNGVIHISTCWSVASIPQHILFSSTKFCRFKNKTLFSIYKCRGLSVFKVYKHVLVFTYWYLNSGNSVIGCSIKFVSQHSGNTIFIIMGKLFVCAAAVIVLFILIGGK